MKALDQPFTKIINGTMQFVIPVFQRDYSWTEDQCEQLWKDILHVAESKTDRGHFIGSVVYIATGDTSTSFTRWLLIDGQQRVTTVTLLLAALRDHIAETGWKGTEDGPTVKRINAYFLKNSEEEGGRHHKLVLRRHDQGTLKAILDNADMPEEVAERVKDNYDYFREQLNEGVDPEIVYRGIGRLIVVDVTLDRGSDDPQLIFESLNSTGVDLSQSDLIRNFILMRLPEKEQTQLYENWWSKIENLFRGSEKTFDTFVRDYLALKTQANKQKKADEIYRAFRSSFQPMVEEAGDVESFLADMLRHARYYAAFAIGGNDDPGLAVSLSRLRRLVDAPAVLIMRLFHLHEQEKTLSKEDFLVALALVESFVFRRAICGFQTRGYWPLFSNLGYQIKETEPLESMKVGLARQSDNYRFPGDDEFQRELSNRDLYGMRVCSYMLDRFENHDTKEPTDTSSYSIEHIMPQNEKLLPEWQEMLGADWKDVRAKWLHRLGNLTLTGYNSEYKDRPFQIKKTIAKGFEESSVRLNKFVREQEKWTAVEIEQRGKLLAEKAIKIWSPLSVAPAAIEAAEQAELRALAEKRDVKKVKMTPEVRELFNALSPKIKELDPNILELAEKKSVSYHGPSFFLEVLPRKRRLSLLLPLDFNEVKAPESSVQDATEWKFLVNAVYEGGATVRVKTLDDIENAIPIIRQSLKLA